MIYTFNKYGWYTGTTTSDWRGTRVEPSNKSTSDVVGDMRSIWAEKGWLDRAYFEPAAAPDTTMKDARAILMDRQNAELDRPYGVKGTNVDPEELYAITEMLSGAGVKKFNFRNGSMTLTASNRSAVLAAIAFRKQSVHDRAYDIIELVKAENGRRAKLVVFNNEINSGWPS